MLRTIVVLAVIVVVVVVVARFHAGVAVVGSVIFQ